MAVTAGALSLNYKTQTQASLTSEAASAGTSPYTYQWYRSTESGFTPGAGNLVSGATSLTLLDSGLNPNTAYYYKVIATDTGASNATSTSDELAVTTSGQDQNQFQQSPTVGQLDLRFNPNSVSVQIDSSETATLQPGQAVKMVDSLGGVPKVIACAADDDDALGFLNFNAKDISYTAGDMAEMSMAGNVMFLVATAAIARGAQVALDYATIGGVKPVSGSGGENIVGWAFDKASAGSVFRVYLKTPSFAYDA